MTTAQGAGATTQECSLRALITGYGGFAGSHLAEHLLSETDWRIWGTVYPADAVARHHQAAVAAMPADLRDPAVTAEAVAAADPDLVFHLAGQSSVHDAWRDPWATFETNVRMQVNLHQALAARGRAVRMVVVTSNEVYGAPPPERLPVDETAPLAPLNPYAASKVAQDMMAELYGLAHDEVEVIRVRPFTHIGPHQDSRFVTASFARQVAEIEAGVAEPRVRVGNLSAERDFSDVRDIVRGYRLVAERGRPGEVYNLGSGRAHAIEEVLNLMVAHSGVDVEVVRDPELTRPSDVPRTLCDAGKAHRELGWAAEIPFERTLADILDAWRAVVAARPSPEPEA